MKAVLGSIGALLFSAAILLAGGGLLGTLVAVSAELNNFPLIAIGFLSSAYFAGFMGGCIFTPHLVKRVGHVRVFASLELWIYKYNNQALLRFLRLSKFLGSDLNINNAARGLGIAT